MHVLLKRLSYCRWKPSLFFQHGHIYIYIYFYLRWKRKQLDLCFKNNPWNSITQGYNVVGVRCGVTSMLFFCSVLFSFNESHIILLHLTNAQSLLIWWSHQMETFSALLALCEGNLPVTGEFLSQRPVTRSFDVLFDLRLNKRLSKQSWCWWFETPSRPLWRQCNDMRLQHISTTGSFHTPAI